MSVFDGESASLGIIESSKLRADGEVLKNTPLFAYKKTLLEKRPELVLKTVLNVQKGGAAAYQLGNTSSRTITEVKQR